MPGQLTHEGLDELLKRFDVYPRQVIRVIGTVMRASLDIIHSEVPAYPPKPSTSTYERTGTLGRSLGVGITGGKAGRPQIYDVTKAGQKWQAKFGTRLNYAPYVIGSRAFQQAQPYKDYWWTLPDTVAARARPRIQNVFNQAAEKLARWIDRQSL